MVDAEIRKSVEIRAQSIIAKWCNFVGEKKSDNFTVAEWTMLKKIIKQEIWKELVNFDKRKNENGVS